MKSIQFLLDPTTQRCDLKQYTHSESAAKNDYSYVKINKFQLCCATLFKTSCIKHGNINKKLQATKIKINHLPTSLTTPPTRSIYMKNLTESPFFESRTKYHRNNQFLLKE